MIIGPKYKIAKRLGAPVFEKTQTQKFALSEARGARTKQKRGPGGMSDYKRQLNEKQKMRFVYGISERQVERYVKESLLESSKPIEALYVRLESRLDNVVHRLGFAKTRRLARQIVSHGHITVNGKRLNVPSYKVRTGDVIAVRAQSTQSPLFLGITESLLQHQQPHWLTLDAKNLSGSKKAEPTYTASENLFSPEQVFEYYSR